MKGSCAEELQLRYDYKGGPKVRFLLKEHDPLYFLRFMKNVNLYFFVSFILIRAPGPLKLTLVFKWEKLGFSQKCRKKYLLLTFCE